MKDNFRNLVLKGFAVSIAFSSQGQTFEKNIWPSGHYAGVGNAAVGSVSGAESTIFNPAGLGGNEGLQATVNLSPTFVQFSGPFLPNETLNSNTNFTIVPNIAASYAISPQLSLGASFYVSGAADSTYDNVSFAGINPFFQNLTPTVNTDFRIEEISLAAGYEVLDGLRIGVGYRIAIMKANLVVTGLSPDYSQLLQYNYNDLSGTQFNGFRVGVQYSPKDSNWGLGAHWRNEINFNATGTASGVVSASNTLTQMGSSNMSLTAVLPQEVSIGAWYDVIPGKFKLLGEYDWYEYSKDSVLSAAGSLMGSSLPSITLNWNNISTWRFGSEIHINPNWIARIGYVHSSSLSNKSYATPNLTAPGGSNSFVVGGGVDLADNLILNFALEYNFINGTVTTSDGPAAIPGDYSDKIYGAHLGLSYKLGV